MKYKIVIFLVAVCLLAACVGQKNRIIFRPDPEQEEQEPINFLDHWQIIETENGQGETDIPEWIRGYFDGGIRGIEYMDRYSGKYIFVGENRGENITALQHWLNGFTVLHDLPRLVAARVERRLVASASLYPDDEYGQYFENLMKKVADGEYPGAVIERTFWVKLQRIPDSGDDDDELPQGAIDAATEIYVFFVSMSIDREVLQGQLRQIMADITTTVPPRRDQAAAIGKIQQTFFEGF